MKLVDLLWKLPYGKRTAVRFFAKFSALYKRDVINLQKVSMEIDVTKNLDMEYAYGKYDALELAFLQLLLREKCRSTANKYVLFGGRNAIFQT